MFIHKGVMERKLLKRVIIIDDQLAVREVVTRILRGGGFEVTHSFEMVQDALKFLGYDFGLGKFKSDPSLLADIIITDNKTPNSIRGYEFIKILKKYNMLSVLLTAYPVDEDEFKRLCGDSARLIYKDVIHSTEKPNPLIIELNELVSSAAIKNK